MLSLKTLLAWASVLLQCDLALAKHIPTFAGPYIGFVHRFDVCPSDGSVVIHLKNTHYNRARPREYQSLWGNASLKMPFDDTMWGHVNMAVRANNEWKENAFIFNFPSGGCSTLREHVPPLFRILKKVLPALNDPKAPCVFTPGQYIIENDTISWEFPRFKIMPYGHYRFTVTIGKTNRIKRMCLECDVEVIPKLD